MNAQRYNIIGGMGQDAVKVLQHSGQFPQEATAEQDYIFTGQGEVTHAPPFTMPLRCSERYAPYVLALVKLAERPRDSAIDRCDAEQVQIGMPVEMVTRKLHRREEGMIVCGYKFRPTLMGVSA
ncbi:MAG: OB-fold domain-containing protein [Chloroflexi bacterium]|nr:OB-fold domain-containing protein [Chloroflexota bacterium]